VGCRAPGGDGQETEIKETEIKIEIGGFDCRRVIELKSAMRRFLALLIVSLFAAARRW
jgi:hypothetical protein